MSSVMYMAKRLEDDLRGFLPHVYKNPLEKLAIMTASVVEARSCHLMEFAARLPLATQWAASRYAWIERFLSTDTLDDMDAMDAPADAAIAAAAQNGRTIVVCFDRTSVGLSIGRWLARRARPDTP